MMEDTTPDIDPSSIDPVKLILACKEKAEDYRSQQYVLEKELRAEFDKMLQVHPERLALMDQANEWNKTFKEAVENLFTQGTVVQNGTSSVYYIVESVYDGKLDVRIVDADNKKLRMSSSTFIYVGRDTRIIPYYSILDKRVREFIGKCIAQIRLKDW